MPINILMPALSPTMEEGVLAKWRVREGDTVSAGDVIAEIETDKATMEVEAVDEGVIGKIAVPEGSAAVKVNAVIAVLLEDGETVAALDAPQAATHAPKAPQGPSKARATDDERVFASPLARRLAAEKGVSLAALKGSGPHGRIVKSDVDRAEPEAVTPERSFQSAPPAPERAALHVAATDAIKNIYADRRYQEILLDNMRKTIAARLVESKQTVPHFYLRRDIEIDAILALREKLNERAAAHGVKLSVNDFIIKACALALQKAPGCNAIWAGDRILQFKASDVAVAVAVDGGLFTPVLRDAEAKSLSALSAEMKALATKARARKLAPHEYSGGAFAISNLGMFGIDNFDAIINPPQSSILAVGAGVKRPVARGDELAIATVMSVTLSVDHRVIDGALGASFLSAFKASMEDPLSMLI